MGLPERFAETEVGGQQILTSRPLKRTVLVLAEHDEMVQASLKSPLWRGALGTQYLFGIIPLTKLFLPHDKESFAVESLISALHEEGYHVFASSARNAEYVAEVIRPDLTLNPKFEWLSVNAYDAIFFRIAHISGLLRLQAFCPGQQKLIADDPLTLGRTSYRRVAHGPTLARILEETLRDSLRREVARLSSMQHSCGMTDLSSNDSCLFVLPPQMVTTQSKLGQVLADSYGYTGLKPLSDSQIARVAQRGIIAGAQQLGLCTVAVCNLQNIKQRYAGYYLSSTITAKPSTQVRGYRETSEIQLTLLFSLAASPERHLSQELYSCALSVKAISGVDAPWIVAVETAIRDAFLVSMGHEMVGDSSIDCKKINDS